MTFLNGFCRKFDKCELVENNSVNMYLNKILSRESKYWQNVVIENSYLRLGSIVTKWQLCVASVNHGKWLKV